MMSGRPQPPRPRAPPTLSDDAQVPIVPVGVAAQEAGGRRADGAAHRAERHAERPPPPAALGQQPSDSTLERRIEYLTGQLRCTRW